MWFQQDGAPTHTVRVTIKFYINRTRDLDKLKDNIIQEICNLTPDILTKVTKTVVQRMCLCLNNNGER